MTAFRLGAVLLAACISGVSLADNAQTVSEFTCGYSVTTGTNATWNNGYQGWASVNNESGETATDFEVFLDVENTAIIDGYQAEYESVDGGYLVGAPAWLQWQKIPQGGSYQFGFNGSGNYAGITPYLIAVNGEICDPLAPEVSLTASNTVFTSESTLTLAAEASDNVGLLKVVFENNGVVIAEDYDAPYSLELTVTEALNGSNQFTATAIDFTGNSASANSEKVFAAVGNRFLGSAPGGESTYAGMSYFNQLTPENAGKWGSVEAERDVMNWDGMDAAYAYSREQGIPIKLHTLVWGQQAPSWINDLSAEEQLSEVEEWYAELAARYPEAEMIDVVNEPLHAPASYREALGGAGETGWDWVIAAFEMARDYFPDAQLLLNDYNVLILENYTADYLAVVEVLQQRGLIDGIGVQAHFLERAELAVVETNVATLAATGLPIYVSELDVNFADDARHANRLADLFSIFWNNPSVVGVTHWGHLQGTVWRSDSYLIRTDGSLRPGMEWLLCYTAGGSDCSLPEYIPAGWFGTDAGLTLQAEEYDDARGVAPLGSNVTYADGGDWFSFAKVNFNEGWDTFWVSYAKGSDTETTFSVHLDSLDAEPVLEVPFTNTGGWGVASELEVALPSISGEHDVYFRFNGSYAAGNVDYISFGVPAGLGPNLVANGDFEEGHTNYWFSWNGGVVQATSEHVYEGAYALLVAERAGNAPAAYDITSQVSAGETYVFTMMASITGAEQASVNVTLKVNCDGSDSYNWIVNPVTIADGEWVELAAETTLPECEIGQVQFFAEGPGADIDLYLDSVSIRQVTGSADMGLLPNAGFESGDTSGWFSWSGGVVQPTTELVYEGAYALQVAERAGNAPAAYNMTSLVSPGVTYNASVAVSITGAAEAPVNVTVKTACEGEDASYTWMANSGAVLEGEWTLLSGQIAVPDCELNELLVYAEGPDAGIDLYLDSFIITE